MKLPTDLLRAYYAIDLAALAKSNPSGRPSARRSARPSESARDRLEHEAKDGRYTKRKAIEVVWDRKSNELLFGTTSVAQIDRLLRPVQEHVRTRDRGGDRRPAGVCAGRAAQPDAQRGRRLAVPVCPRVCRRRTWPGFPTRRAGTSSATSSCCGSGTSATTSRRRSSCSTVRRRRSSWPGR